MEGKTKNTGVAFPRSVPIYFNPLFTGRLFHCYLFDKSVCHFKDVGTILLLLFYF